jgi:hypothetical protein
VPLDFPSGPAINDTWTGSNGVTYTWTGTMWTVSGSGTGPYLPLTGGTMTGALALAADPTTSPQAANKHYVDQSINLAGNYLGTWSVAANTPNISAGGSISNANYVAVTVNPATPEVVPVGVPGIAGLTVGNGDRIIWAAGPNVWQILRNAGVTLAAADARYVALSGSNMTGPLVLPGNAGSALHAVPLQQVPAASSTTPAMDGTATIGALTTYAKADHIHPTDTSRYAATNPAGYQTAAQVTAVIPGISYADNGGFAINQRSYVSGTALAAGAFGHDRWKAGAGGCTYTFTQSGNPTTTITITAGTLQQVVEGVALVGGNYTLSWTGTALGRISGGAYVASPVVTSAVSAGVNTTIEFNTGTLGRVKFEAGMTVTPWVALPPQQDLANCQRYFFTGAWFVNGYAATGANAVAMQAMPGSMRAAPALAIAGSPSLINCSAPTLTAYDTMHFTAMITVTAGPGSAQASGVYTATADL